MKKFIVMMISVLTGLFVGLFLVFSADKDYTIHLLLAIILSFIYTVIIHEFGHFVFGKISGYKFVSFRVLNLLIYRNKDNKLKMKFVTHNPMYLGQCLLYYPKESDNIPYKLYNYGGVIFNLFSAVVFTVLAFVINKEIASHVLIIAAVLNLMVYSQNGIDFDKNMINDKKNINSMNKYPHAVKYLYNQLLFSKKASEGLRLSEFDINMEVVNYDDLELIPFSYSNFSIYYCYLLDCKRYDDAEKLLETIYLRKDKLSQVVNLHFYMLYFNHLVLINKNYDKAISLYAELDKKYLNSYLNRMTPINTIYNIAFSIVTKKHINYINSSIKLFEKQIKKESFNADKNLDNYFLDLIKTEVDENKELYKFNNMKHKLVCVNVTRPIGYEQNNVIYTFNYGEAINPKNRKCFIIDNNVNEPLQNYIGYLVAEVRNVKTNKIYWIVSQQKISKNEILNKISTTINVKNIQIIKYYN